MSHPFQDILEKVPRFPPVCSPALFDWPQCCSVQTKNNYQGYLCFIVHQLAVSSYRIVLPPSFEFWNDYFLSVVYNLFACKQINLSNCSDSSLLWLQHDGLGFKIYLKLLTKSVFTYHDHRQLLSKFNQTTTVAALKHQYSGSIEEYKVYRGRDIRYFRSLYRSNSKHLCRMFWFITLIKLLISQSCE